MQQKKIINKTQIVNMQECIVSSCLTITRFTVYLDVLEEWDWGNKIYLFKANQRHFE